jgi:hypothetical protein
MLFPVMRDMISCEEVFEADPRARAEFDAVCDEWLNEAIVAQDDGESDFENDVDEDCGWFGYEGLCED